MNQQNIKYIYFDLDGTTLNKRRVMTTKTIETIKKLKDKGIKVGLATGRPYFMLKREINNIQPDLPTIAANGALVMDVDNSEIISHGHDQNEYDNLIKSLDELRLEYFCFTSKGMFYSSDKSFYLDWLSNWRKDYRGNEWWTIEPLESKNTNDITYKIEITTTEDEDSIINKIKGINKKVDVLSSQPQLVDIMPQNISKGNAIQELITIKGYDPKEIMFFGDNDNDVSVFKVIENSVSMSNSLKAVRQQSKYCTKTSNDENGVALFLEEFFSL